MCHTDGSRPPAAPIAGGLAEATETHLTSADGIEFMAYHARPAHPSGQAAVVLPDFRGLHDFYRLFARRLAGAGIEAIAIDYYGRSLPDGSRDEPMERMFPLLMELTAEQVAADARAAADELRAAGAVFSIGFCFGGSQAWNQSAFDHGLAGCVGFYGRPDDCRPYLADLRVPMLLLVAGADAMTPVADFHAFDRELSGVDHAMVVYDGAPHGFFDAAAGHEDTCADAWRRLLGFLDRNTS